LRSENCDGGDCEPQRKRVRLEARNCTGSDCSPPPQARQERERERQQIRVQQE
jgi:hypothetical protein